MKILFFVSIFLAITTISAKAESPEITAAKKNGTVYLFFGARKADGTLKRTRKIQWKPGNQYGWDVTVISTLPSIKIKEILILPSAAKFIENEGNASGRTSKESIITSADQTTLIKEFTLDTSKPIKYKRTFKIIDSDPKGAYQFQFYINDEVAADLQFTVEDGG
jgi:hypothetical protein